MLSRPTNLGSMAELAPFSRSAGSIRLSRGGFITYSQTTTLRNLSLSYLASSSDTNGKGVCDRRRLFLRARSIRIKQRADPPYYRVENCWNGPNTHELPRVALSLHQDRFHPIGFERKP